VWEGMGSAGRVCKSEWLKMERSWFFVSRGRVWEGMGSAERVCKSKWLKMERRWICILRGVWEGMGSAESAVFVGGGRGIHRWTERSWVCSDRE
jgi:hypothetical protein